MKKLIVIFVISLFITGFTGMIHAASPAKGTEYVGIWVAVNAQNYIVGILEISPAAATFVVKELSFAGKVKSETPGNVAPNGSLQAGKDNYSYDLAKKALIREDGLQYRRSSQEELESIKKAFKNPTPDVNY